MDGKTMKLVGNTFMDFINNQGESPLVINFYHSYDKNSVNFLFDFKALSEELTQSYPDVKFAQICTY